MTIIGCAWPNRESKESEMQVCFATNVVFWMKALDLLKNDVRFPSSILSLSHLIGPGWRIQHLPHSPLEVHAASSFDH